MLDGLVHFAAVAKAHLDLGGVYVHVHAGGIDLHVQRVNRLFLAVQHVFIRTFGGVGDDLVAHKAAVDVAVLLVRAAACGIGQACAAIDGDAAGGRGAQYGNGVADEIVTEHIAQTPGQSVGALLAVLRIKADGTPLLHQLAFVPDGKAHIGARQRMAAHGLDAVRQLRGIALEEFAACGRAEKQFLDFQRRAAAACSGAQFAAARFQQPGLWLTV